MNSNPPDSTSNPSKRRAVVAGWLFLLGSLIFVVNSAITLTQAPSLEVGSQLVASVMFAVGSALFIPHE
ncbi:MAG TPA: hypothetical protein V6C88_00660 [Chroococcidiopsis sp.]